jgi:glutamate carboxypeptidase
MMNLHELPLDAEELLSGLRPRVECESPTWDASAVNRAMDVASEDFAEAGALIDRIPGRLGFGDCVRAHFAHPSTAPGILILGHLDTVHPVGTLSKLHWRREDNRCFGPGILDMKAGNYMALEAIRQIQRAGLHTQLPVTVLLTSDEEVGSPSTRELIEAEARRHAFVLVPEPALPDNAVVSGRFAIARYNLETTGKPSHAGVRPKEGRSAIREMARQVITIEEMSDENCTFSVGVIHGGQWVNCVATTCTGEALSMAKRQEDLDQGVGKILGLAGVHNDVEFKVTRGVTRPVWEPDSGTLELFDLARRIAESLGMELSHGSAGGGSDGNFTGAMGIPTLDGLGCRGDGYHTLQEHVIVPSLVDRTRLLCGLLMELG